MGSLFDDLGLSVATSETQANQPVGVLNGQTYINFGSGLIDAPSEEEVNPTQTPTSTATASVAQTPAATGGKLVYVALGVGILALLVSLFKPK
jgi:hypothetical protein